VDQCGMNFVGKTAGILTPIYQLLVMLN